MFTGVDIEDISRIEKKTLENDTHFLTKIYTQKELDYCFSKKLPAPHLAARFCAKEAVIKALNSLNPKITFSNIEILNHDTGAPYVVLHNIDLAVEISVSLSHDRDKAVAFAVAYKKDVV